MDGVLNECYECAAPYIDDILIFFKELGGAYGWCEEGVRCVEEAWVDGEA